MKNVLGTILVLLLNQVLFAGEIRSGVTLGADCFLSSHGQYFNPAFDAGYRVRTALGKNAQWQIGGEVNLNYFVNKPGVTGLFVGMPLKLAIERQFSIRSWNINPGFAAGAYLSILKDDANSIFGQSLDIIAASPHIEFGPTLKNGSQILAIMSYDLILTTTANGGMPMMVTTKVAYIF